MVLAVSGCGIAKETGKTVEEPAMSMQEAAEEADKIISSTMRAVKPPITWAHSVSSESSCGTSGEDIGTGAVTRRAAVLTVISGERRGSFLGVLERHWKKSGYEITNVRNHPDNPAMFAATPDDFRMSMEVGYKGQAFLDVTTPCMTESEVAPPRPAPSGPEYTGEKPPLPDRHSDFWSARAPVPSGGPEADGS
ncbi:hypothetical protein ACGRHY_04025 [Streptomyces sp. HK10]|uniref:hypothetical protein n=1 Tax=Streptomyces sp. HK10 TaxID=3373255 RepID=UPI003748DF2D